MASSSRRAFIGDQKTPSRPSLTAVPMIGNSGAPLEHLVHPAVCETVSLEQSRLHVLEPTFFRKWGRGGRGPGASPGVTNPPPGPPRRLAAQGGKGELCTALNTVNRGAVSPTTATAAPCHCRSATTTSRRGQPVFCSAGICAAGAKCYPA
jgi:hypothetical protein